MTKKTEKETELDTTSSTIFLQQPHETVNYPLLRIFSDQPQLLELSSTGADSEQQISDCHLYAITVIAYRGFALSNHVVHLVTTHENIMP